MQFRGAGRRRSLPMIREMYNATLATVCDQIAFGLEHQADRLILARCFFGLCHLRFDLPQNSSAAEFRDVPRKPPRRIRAVHKRLFRVI